MPFNNNSYNINWVKLTRWANAFRLVKPKTSALLNALISPIAELHLRFLQFRHYTNYRLSITPQIVYLEKLLNDRFDPQLKRIRIVKGVEYLPIPFFQKIENKPVKLFTKAEAVKKVLYTKAETATFSVDFIVRVPILVPFDMKELMAYLDIDVLPSKVYKVQIV